MCRLTARIEPFQGMVRQGPCRFDRRERAHLRFDKPRPAPLVSRPRRVTRLFPRRPFVMNITVEKQPNCIATLRVEVPSATVNTERAKIVSGYAAQARIPGFRPGKAPKNVIEKKFQTAIVEASWPPT